MNKPSTKLSHWFNSRPSAGDPLPQTEFVVFCEFIVDGITVAHGSATVAIEQIMPLKTWAELTRSKQYAELVELAEARATERMHEILRAAS